MPWTSLLWLAPLALAFAGPPEGPAEAPPGEAPSMGSPPVGEPAPEAFWLSAELIGPRGGQLDAARSLATPPVIADLPRGGSQARGEVVGRVRTLDEALAWVDAHAFGPESAAPRPGGHLRTRHGVILTALVVTAAAPGGGSESFTWPERGALEVPDELDWVVADLGVPRAPLFAAPAPSLPAASERFLVAEAEHDLWLLGELDRCDELGACLRWAQVLARDGDRFFGGWLPAASIVPRREWVESLNGPAGAVRPSHRTRDRVVHVLLLRHGEAQNARIDPPRSIPTPHARAEWPPASFRVFASQAATVTGTVLVDGRPALELDLTPQLLGE